MKQIIGYSIPIDAACTEALNYLISNGLISLPDRRALYEAIAGGLEGKGWLEKFHRFQLLDKFNMYKNTSREHADDSRSAEGSLLQGLAKKRDSSRSRGFSSAMVLVRKAEKFFEEGCLSLLTKASKGADKKLDLDELDSLLHVPCRLRAYRSRR